MTKMTIHVRSIVCAAFTMHAGHGMALSAAPTHNDQIVEFISQQPKLSIVEIVAPAADSEFVGLIQFAPAGIGEEKPLSFGGRR